MTTPRVLGVDPHATRRPVGAALLLGMVVFLIVSILVCLPAFHSATSLHHGPDVVDAFDLGVNVTETTRGSLPVVALSALLLAGLWHERKTDAGPRLAQRTTGSHFLRRAASQHKGVAHDRRHTRAPRGDSNDDPSSLFTASLFHVEIAPRTSVHRAEAEGFFFDLKRTPDHPNSRTNEGERP